MSEAPVQPLYNNRRMRETSQTKTMAPTKQKAVVITENGPTLCLADVPKPGPGQILVEVVAAAQNPTDCQFALTFGMKRVSSNIL